MATTKVEYDIETPWTVTRNNWVGPTAVVADRPNSFLPHSAARSNGTPDFDTINVLNDANTIYMDPFDGSDSNTGTTLNTDAVLTFSKAESLITVTRQHIHIEIFDTGTHGFASTFSELDLDGGFPNPVPLDANLRTIQVASGQTSKGTFTSDNVFGFYSITAPLAIHGLEVDQPTQLALLFLVADAGSTLTVDYCKISASIGCFQSNSVATTYNKSIFESFGGFYLALAGVSTQTIRNCIFKPRTGAIIDSIAIRTATGATIDFEHNLYIGMLHVYDTTIPGLIITNNHSHIIQNCTAYQPSDSTGHVLAENSLINVGVPIHPDATNSTNVLNQDPLFIDEAAGLAGDPTGFQLAHVGRISNGFNYPKNSPAVGIGQSDAGAWDYTYVQGAETVNTFELDPADGYTQAAPMERVNYQKFNDILGAARNTWDGVIWVVDFKFGSKYFFGGDPSYQFLRMFRSKSFKRYYPYGNDGLFGAMLGVTSPATDQINFGSNIPGREINGTPIAGTKETIPDTYIGWTMKVSWTDSGSKTGWFEIQTHTDKTFTLLHIRGDVDFNAGSAITANITDLPIILAMKTLPLAADYESEDETTGTVKPFFLKGDTDAEGNQSGEWHLRKFRFEQTRED